MKLAQFGFELGAFEYEQVEGLVPGSSGAFHATLHSSELPDAKDFQDRVVP